MSAPFRKVVRVEYTGACRYTGYIAKRINLTLECGHVLSRKASAGAGERARCEPCERGEPVPGAGRVSRVQS